MTLPRQPSSMEAQYPILFKAAFPKGFVQPKLPVSEAAFLCLRADTKMRLHCNKSMVQSPAGQMDMMSQMFLPSLMKFFGGMMHQGPPRNKIETIVKQIHPMSSKRPLAVLNKDDSCSDAEDQPEILQTPPAKARRIEHEPESTGKLEREPESKGKLEREPESKGKLPVAEATAILLACPEGKTDDGEKKATKKATTKEKDTGASGSRDWVRIRMYEDNIQNRFVCKVEGAGKIMHARNRWPSKEKSRNANKKPRLGACMACSKHCIAFISCFMHYCLVCNCRLGAWR